MLSTIIISNTVFKHHSLFKNWCATYNEKIFSIFRFIVSSFGFYDGAPFTENICFHFMMSMVGMRCEHGGA